MYSIPYDLRFAEMIPENDGGRHIVLAADRPVAFWQLWNQPLSTQLPFTVIELHVNSAGDGDGRLWVPGHIAANRSTDSIEIDGHSAFKVLLMNVHGAKPTT
jgi:hypothetical protein